MGGDGDHVGSRKRQLAGGLRAVDHEQAPKSPQLVRDFRDRLKDARFIVCMLDRDNRPVAAQAIKQNPPVRIHRIRTASGAARNTASCSTAETKRCPPLARPSAIASASLAPEVKITCPGQSSAAATRRRADSSAAFAARPSACGELGLCHCSSPATKAARAVGAIGLVAA
jgi:hypothetical protein